MSTFARLKGKTCSIIGSINTTDHATELGEWANEAVRDVLLRTGVKVSVGTVTLTAGTTDYTLDDEVLLIKNAFVDGSSDSRLVQVSSGELLAMRISGASARDPVTYYALEGGDLFQVYPAPATNGTISLTYVPKPTEMSADGNDPSNATYGGIPVEHHRALEMYMLWRAADYDDDASSAQGERYREQYEREIKQIRQVVNAKGNTRLPSARVGRRRFISPDRSKY